MKLWDKNQTATRSPMMQIFYNVTHSSLRRRPQTTRQQQQQKNNEQAFSYSLGCFRSCFFLYFVNNSGGTWLVYISQTELYVIFLY